MNAATSSPPSAANAGGEVADQAGCRSPGCACAARRPSAGPARRAPRTSIGPVRSSSAASTRPRAVAEEAQALDGLVVADAEPERPPRPLVERRERAHAARLVLDDPDRHRRRADAGHRARRGRARCRSRGASRRGEQRARRRRGRRPSPRTGRPRRSARRCGSHTRSQAIGGPGVQRARRRRARRSRRPRGATVSARGRTPSIALDRRRVGPLDRARRAAPQSASSSATRRGVAAGRRAPVDVDDVGALVAHARRRTPSDRG